MQKAANVSIFSLAFTAVTFAAPASAEVADISVAADNLTDEQAPNEQMSDIVDVSAVPEQAIAQSVQASLQAPIAVAATIVPQTALPESVSGAGLALSAQASDAPLVIPAPLPTYRGLEPRTANQFGGKGGDSGVSVSGSAAITSDYRFRGVSLSNGDPAFQGSIELGLPAGFYVGTWGSTLPESGGFGAIELDLYGGWTGQVAEGLSLDTGFTYYVYPDAPVGDFDYIELYSSIKFTLGPAQAKFGTAYAPSQSALADNDNFYLYSDLSGSIPGTSLTLTGHLGYTDGALTYTADQKAWDYSLGAEWTFNRYLSAEAKYVAVDGPTVDGLTDDTVVFTLTASF